MLTQGFSQALQILKDTYLKVDEAVPQPKPADSLQTCSLSLELPTPLNKPKKHCKQDTKKIEQNNHFFTARSPVTIMLLILKKYKEESIKVSLYRENEIW